MKYSLKVPAGMTNLGLIIRREFSTRVRKRSFIILTLLAPVLMAILLFLPAYLATLPGDEKLITILDESVLMDIRDKGTEEIRFRYLNPKDFDFETAKALAEGNGDYAFLHVPLSEGGDPDFVARNIRIFREGDLSIAVENHIERSLEKYLQKEKLKFEGVDPEIVARTKTNVKLRVINTKAGVEAENATLLKMGIGYVCAFAIYLFIFIYGSQVMRGVIEEKTNRIMELMISSIKPFELMMGKIIGIGALALLQFVIWIGLGALIFTLFSAIFIDPSLSAPAGAGTEQFNALQDSTSFEIYRSLQTVNWWQLLGSFIFYFLGGYLLYGALFAAIGSAVDKEADSQQFILPITIPLILSLLVIIRALDNPDGAIATWMSIIPLSSPLVMMARIPFGVPGWELLLSMVILAISFVFCVWIAAKIYRIGVLMYGKKPTFKELYRWTRYKN
ncbi:MAG: ABC transporter permease [Croceimicrobium sp.]